MIYFAAVLFVVLLAALLKMHRVRELHHGFYGAVIAAIGQARSSEWMIWVGVLLLLDDVVQHVTEVFWGKARYMDDWTPIHRIGAYIVGLYRKLV